MCGRPAGGPTTSGGPRPAGCPAATTADASADGCRARSYTSGNSVSATSCSPPSHPCNIPGWTRIGREQRQLTRGHAYRSSACKSDCLDQLIVRQLSVLSQILEISHASPCIWRASFAGIGFKVDRGVGTRSSCCRRYLEQFWISTFVGVALLPLSAFGLHWTALVTNMLDRSNPTNTKNS